MIADFPVACCSVPGSSPGAVEAARGLEAGALQHRGLVHIANMSRAPGGDSLK